MSKALSLMLQGTGSDVGKTVLVAGLCRALKRRGISVLPFKPQNMSNNAAVADPDIDGAAGEMGRAQWLQALASGVGPSVHMNPVLLKPQSQTGSQVIVQGKVFANAKAKEYFTLKPRLMERVMESYKMLCERAEIVLVEGAGSPAEINLRAGDIANMGFAERANVPVVLVGDIDRGGVIASIVGTHTILPDDDRRRIVGYLINKFRGDVSLFDEGLRAIEGFTGWRSFGIIPHLDCVRKLPAEDSLALEKLVRSAKGKVKIVVPVMGKIANFDDLDPLLNEEEVDLQFIRKGEDFPAHADLVVLPGSKSTIADRIEFGENGWDEALKHHVEQGGMVIGICGGYQMLGKTICDPQRVEGNIERVEGLGLLDVVTELRGNKVVRNTNPRTSKNITDRPVMLEGYEIHLGRTTGPDCKRAMIESDNGVGGAVSEDGKVMGSYLHGLFESDEFRRLLLARFDAKGGVGHRQIVEEALDELAEAMERFVDVEGLLGSLR